jgi:hypothetical protein
MSVDCDASIVATWLWKQRKSCELMTDAWARFRKTAWEMDLRNSVLDFLLERRARREFHSIPLTPTVLFSVATYVHPPGPVFTVFGSLYTSSPPHAARHPPNLKFGFCSMLLQYHNMSIRRS